jgi:hypothetical protein
MKGTEQLSAPLPRHPRLFVSRKWESKNSFHRWRLPVGSSSSVLKDGIIHRTWRVKLGFALYT